MPEHSYTARVVWTGNTGDGTRGYKSYKRTWNVETPGKPVLHCSNDPLLGGDPALFNPEDLLLSSLSACHMLWYLHLASDAGFVITSYVDNPIGIGEVGPDGRGQFIRAVLRPVIALEKDADSAQADAIHARIHDYCFIARSVSFPVVCEAVYKDG